MNQMATTSNPPNSMGGASNQRESTALPGSTALCIRPPRSKNPRIRLTPIPNARIPRATRTARTLVPIFHIAERGRSNQPVRGSGGLSSGLICPLAKMYPQSHQAAPSGLIKPQFGQFIAFYGTDDDSRSSPPAPLQKQNAPPSSGGASLEI